MAPVSLTTAYASVRQSRIWFRFVHAIWPPFFGLYVFAGARMTKWLMSALRALPRRIVLRGLAADVLWRAARSPDFGKIEKQTGTGQFAKLTTDQPFSVGEDDFDDDNLYAFDEVQNIILPLPIRVDIGGENGVISQGSTVASHQVFFDSPILGVAAFKDIMGDTDFLANTSINYIGTELRGLEPGDSVWVDERDPFRLWIYWAGSSPGDYVRVFMSLSPGAGV